VKTEAQAGGVREVNDVVIDVFARDRLITYATGPRRSTRAVNPTNERHGQATTVHAALHAQAQFILE
jgi:hypothetical protein